MLDAKNFELSLKIKVGQKGITFYIQKRNNVNNGTRQ